MHECCSACQAELDRCQAELATCKEELARCKEDLRIRAAEMKQQSIELAEYRTSTRCGLDITPSRGRGRVIALILRLTLKPQ